MPVRLENPQRDERRLRLPRVMASPEKIRNDSVAPPTARRRGCYSCPVRRARTSALRGAAALFVAALTLAGCSAPTVSVFQILEPHPSSTSASPFDPLAKIARVHLGSSPSPTSSATNAPAPTPSKPAELPRGGRRILGRFRVVAFYGAPGGGQLGVLGAGTPEHVARRIEQQAQGFAGFGLPVQPAMELIATVAQGSPGPDGDYSAPIANADILHYLQVAHEHKMLLVLDIQPGRSTFLSQVKTLHRFLLDPSVSIALDSEWKVTAAQTPGNGLIGSSDSGDINAVAHYLSRVVRRHDLPDKLLVVHEFTSSMLPDRAAIRIAPGVETVFHADGFGTPALKRAVYRRLAFPGRPYGAGFKLFFTEDSRLMKPAEVMRLRPRPDVITYQ
jgi:hypothetical protein